MSGVTQITPQIDPRRQALLEARFEGIQRPVVSSNNQMNIPNPMAQVHGPNAHTQGNFVYLT